MLIIRNILVFEFIYGLYRLIFKINCYSWSIHKLDSTLNHNDNVRFKLWQFPDNLYSSINNILFYLKCSLFSNMLQFIRKIGLSIQFPFDTHFQLIVSLITTTIIVMFCIVNKIINSSISYQAPNLNFYHNLWTLIELHWFSQRYFLKNCR